MADTLRSKIRSLNQKPGDRAMLGQNGMRVLTSVASSVTDEVFQNIKAIEDTAFTADYVDVSGEGSDSSIDITLQAGDVLPGAWHNISITSGTIIAYF